MENAPAVYGNITAVALNGGKTMADLISREAYREEILVGECYLDGDTLMTVVNILDCAPAVDAVEVVRCCVCEWWNTEEIGMTGDTCRCERFSLVGYSENYTDPMDFCSYGERREENG